jgi:S-adenosylmethionine:tRNA ribosyltransferase-isomerase
MIAASVAIQRPRDARLLSVDANGRIEHHKRAELITLLRSGDVVVANDAATIPASLSGYHVPSGSSIEVRLAGRSSLSLDEIRCFRAVVFGAGDFRMRTEDRPLPPRMRADDRLVFGPLHATVTSVLNHARLVDLRFEGSMPDIWEGISRIGRPIQYSHVQAPLAVWDTWTSIAGPPVAFEPPSAGFALSWSLLTTMAARGVRFATVTHAAGISSTGDAALDALLPFDEAYKIPRWTAHAIATAKAKGGRVIAVGTTVVRALEHSGGREGESRATQRLGRCSSLKVVDAILSGTHEPGTSHYELLRAFADDSTLWSVSEALDSAGYLTHEFGDSVFVEAKRPLKR